MKARHSLAAIVICVVCAHAGAETYTFVGPQEGLWSNPANWLGGSIPIPSLDSIIRDAQGIHDLGDNFDVGTIYALSSITGTHSFRVHQLVSTQDYSPTHLSPTLNANGDISLFSHLYPNSPDTIPAVRLMLGPLHIGGTIEVTGGVGVFGGLSGEGTIHLNNWSAIEMPGDHQLSSLTVTGAGDNRLDIAGTLHMTGGVPADFAATTLDLGRQTFTLSAPTTAKLSVEGDLKLGSWFIGGQEFYNSNPEPIPVDQIHVSGTLDLTQAQIAGHAFPQNEISTYGDHLVLATYGNRIGEFPQTFIPATQVDWDVFQPLFDMPIHYTNAENSGPGEIWLIIPEPGLLTSLAILLPLTLRGRR